MHTTFLILGHVEMDCNKTLNEVLTDKQLNKILNENQLSDNELISYGIRPACQGLSGFLGEHLKVVLYLKNDNFCTKLSLFVKSVPKTNKPKAQFIDENKYYLRESLMFRIIAETDGAEGESPWAAKAYVYNEDLIVMPDLSVQGYVIRPLHEYLDLDHVLATLRSLAHFHAALANYFTNLSRNTFKHKALFKEIEVVITEPSFFDCPWLRAAAKLTANTLKEFSLRQDQLPKDLEEQIRSQYLDACQDLREWPGTLNVLIHKDLWSNNIMFKYQDDVPMNAVLIDYQCLRYAPPAFDVMIFLYLNTSRAFRAEHEVDVLSYYFSVFLEQLDVNTSFKLKDLKYNEETFLLLCEKARKFGMTEAITIFPFILMEPHVAQVTYDNPDTYFKHIFEDRSEPVIEYAKQCQHFRDRQLEICEEFVERYIWTNFENVKL